MTGGPFTRSHGSGAGSALAREGKRLCKRAITPCGVLFAGASGVRKHSQDFRTVRVLRGATCVFSPSRRVLAVRDGIGA